MGGWYGAAVSSRRKRLLHPIALLFTFKALNGITYFDQGALAGCLRAIRVVQSARGERSTWSDTRVGAVASIFMIGYLITCPIFAALDSKFTSKTLILTRTLVWALACFSTGVSTSYWMLLLSRLCAGIGEAAFGGLTVTIIDNVAPAASRTVWIGTFYSMILVGTAAGMVIGVVGHISFIQRMARGTHCRIHRFSPTDAADTVTSEEVQCPRPLWR